MSWPDLLQLLLHFDRNLGTAIGAYGNAVYLLLFLVLYCEIGIVPLFFLPGDPLLFICGAFCASGALSLWVVMPLVFVATVLGSLTGYHVGRMVGQPVFARDYRWLDKAALLRTRAFYEKHGGVTFLLSPFIAVVRTFAPFIAGVLTMDVRRFVMSVIGGALLWILTLVPAGYFFGNVPLIRDHMGGIVLLGILLGVGALIISALLKLMKRRA